MHGIKDKKRWWAANFCTPHVKCADTPMTGIGLGPGILGGLVFVFALMAIFSVSSEARTVSAIVVPVIAGQRASITMKQMRTTIAEKTDALMAKAGEGNRELTAEEKTAYQAGLKDIKELNTMITDAEVAEIALQDPSRPVPPAVQPQIAKDVVDTKKQFPSRAEIVSRFGKPKLFKGETAAEDAYKCGLWLMAAIYKKPWAIEKCKDFGIPLIKDATNEGTNSQGGFLVPTILENMIIDLRDEYGTFRQLAQVMPMSSDNVNIPRRSGGLTAYAIGESTAPTETTKAWNQVGLIARKWGVLTRYTSEVAEDAIISVAEDLVREIAYAFAFAEDEAGFNADGSGTYHGIQGVVYKFQKTIGAGQLKGAMDGASGHDTFAEIDNTDLTNLMALVPKYAIGNSRWYISQAGFATVFQRLAATAGGNSQDTLNRGLGLQYLGFPIVIHPSMPVSTGDLSDKTMLLFGDLRGAVLMGTRRGLTLMVSEHVYFTTDEIGIRGTQRFDINVHDIGDSTNAGPLVALIGE